MEDRHGILAAEAEEAAETEEHEEPNKHDEQKEKQTTHLNTMN